MAGSATPTIDTSSASRNKAPQSTIRMAHRCGLQRWPEAGDGGPCDRAPGCASGCVPDWAGEADAGGRLAGAAGERRDREGEAAWARLVDSIAQTICMHEH